MLWCHAIGYCVVTYRNVDLAIKIHWYEHPLVGAGGRDTKVDLEVELKNHGGT